MGEELARGEMVPLGPDCVAVPVPDTAKAACDAMAAKLGIPSSEGLIRNRYIGRTFIEGKSRREKALRKYTPLPEVLAAGYTHAFRIGAIIIALAVPIALTLLRLRPTSDQPHR